MSNPCKLALDAVVGLHCQPLCRNKGLHKLGQTLMTKGLIEEALQLRLPPASMLKHPWSFLCNLPPHGRLSSAPDTPAREHIQHAP